MTERWRPWVRLVAVWLPATLACVAAVAVYVWLSSDSLGRAAQNRERVAELESDIVRLEKVRDQAAAERAQAAELEEALDRLYAERFGSLDARLTRILRAVGRATREAGLLPGRFGYSADDAKELGGVRFGIQFAVTGQYSQVRKLLAGLQRSQELLIVDRISFAGEEEAATRELDIAVGVATYLAEAEEEQLAELTGGAAGLGVTSGSR